MKLEDTIYYRLIWPLSLALVLFYSSGKVTPQLPWGLWLPYFDKVAHFFLFGLFATLLYRCRRQATSPFVYALLIIALASLFGLSDEFYQYTNPYRYTEAIDWAADTAGALAAVLAYRYWTFYRDLLEYKIVKSTLRLSKAGSSASEAS